MRNPAAATKVKLAVEPCSIVAVPGVIDPPPSVLAVTVCLFPPLLLPVIVTLKVSTLLFTSTVAEREPDEVGRNETEIEQLLAAASGAPQL